MKKQMFSVSHGTESCSLDFHSYDFVKSIRKDPFQNRLLLIHERPTLQIVECWQEGEHRCLLGRGGEVPFETILYDAQMISNEVLVCSCKSMPVRFYKIQKEQGTNHIQHISSISDKKVHTETFQAPIQLTLHHPHLFGAGKSFISQYDLTKMLVASTVSQLKHYHISTISSISDQLLAGSSSGSLLCIDTRAMKIQMQTKPHVDSITNIKSRNNHQFQFFSTARKDNYCYLWDLRKLDQFIMNYTNDLFGNQRTGLEASSDGSLLYQGTESGQILLRDVETANIMSVHESAINKCISSIVEITDSSICYSAGERDFEWSEDKKKMRQDKQKIGNGVYEVRFG